jgi:hypothetical protein
MRNLPLADAYQRLHGEATRLAGGPSDFAQRAAVYRHLFRASQGNHVFPLIAAHGALWAAGQFRFGIRLARWLVWQYPWSAAVRARQLASLEGFFDALRDVNRRVCIDTYVQFHLTRQFADHPGICRFVSADSLRPLRTLHVACRRGQPLDDRQRRALFEAHFLHEQEQIVVDTLDRATRALDWPLAKWLALRPRVRFAYFPARTSLHFRNFADRQQRIANGLRAFDLGAQAGWHEVERSLEDYGLLDQAALDDRDGQFARPRAIQPRQPDCGLLLIPLR